MNKWILYIDDERFPKTHGEIPWTVARSVAEAKSLILSHGCPVFISFDHDLGDQVPTGHDLAKWLVESDLDKLINLPTDFSFNVHSANPVGRDNIISVLDGYLRFKRTSSVI
jgi:hypothetical protein